MHLYRVMLTIFIFGLVMNSIGELGLYNVATPEHDTGITQATVENLNEGIQSEGLGVLTIIPMLLTIGRVFLGAAICVITILPMLMGYGISLPIAMLVQAPLWLVEIMGIYQMYTGHNAGGME